MSSPVHGDPGRDVDPYPLPRVQRSREPGSAPSWVAGHGPDCGVPQLSSQPSRLLISGRPGDSPATGPAGQREPGGSTGPLAMIFLPLTGRQAGGVSQPLAEPAHLPPATGQQARARAAELAGLAARHGITRLAVASPGRLRGHAGDGPDTFEFQRDATALLGAEVALYSDGALAIEHASPDLVTATPL